MTTSRSGSVSAEFARIAPYYSIPDVSNVRKAFLFVSDTFNDYLVSTGKRDYDEIIPRILLGRLPCVDGFAIPDNVGMVVSVIAYQEMAGLGLSKSVITPQDWQNQGVDYIHVLMQDMTAEASEEDMLQACLQMKAFLDDPENDDKVIYVHCKAGRSRSATLVAVFLAMYGYAPGIELSDDKEANFRNAYEYIKTKRPQVDVGENKAALGHRALTLFGSYNASDAIAASKYRSREHYLSSLEAKDHIRQMTSFRALAEYATEIQYYIAQCKRTNHVRDFFSDILNSTDDSWYARLVNGEGAIKNLLDANKGISEYGVTDKARRAELVNSFINELNTHLLSKDFTVAPQRFQSSGR